MQVTRNNEGNISVKATCTDIGLGVGQFVKIGGDEIVTAAGSGDVPIGYISVPAKNVLEDNAEVTVQTFFNRTFTAKAVGGALAAGDQVKLGAIASGQSTVADLSTGDRKLMVGIVWIGAAENGTVTVLGR